MKSVLAAVRVNPTTEWPALIRAGTSGRPTAPVAPATRIRMAGFLSIVALNAIAKAAGSTKPALYDHFASKDVLFETLLCSIRDDLLAKGQGIGKSPTTEEHKFRSAVEVFFAFVEDRPTKPESS
jgi:hypothetical protein